MTLADDRYGAELLTTTGRVYPFDSVECLVSFLDDRDSGIDVHSSWVTDFANPGQLIRADDAYYLKSETLTSPMGGGLTAFARVEDRDGARNAFGGEVLDWAAVRDTRVSGMAHTHAAGH